MSKPIKYFGLIAAMAAMLCFASTITKADDINIAGNINLTGQSCTAGACQSQNVTFNSVSVLSTNPSPDSLVGSSVSLPNFNLGYNSGAVFTPSSGSVAINGGAAGSLTGTINWMNLVQGGTQGTFDLTVGLSGITGTPGSSPVLQSFLSSGQASGVLTFQFTAAPGLTTVQSLVAMNDPNGINTTISGSVTTPEPASLCLFGFGLLMLAFVYRRRMQRAEKSA
ncbi:MAG: PEP-CTERM sorting domain-containing protein [Acidobacteriota bacterium]|nr:PEP-CTERM sorting domain-containing protein [Acidobacteriota bacterium]